MAADAVNDQKDNENDDDSASRASHDRLRLDLLLRGLRGREASVVFRDVLCDRLAVEAKRVLVIKCLHIPTRRTFTAVAIFKLAAAPNKFILTAPCPWCALGIDVILLCDESAMRTQRAVGSK